MSVETLDRLKQQTNTLTPQEKTQLAKYLLEEAANIKTNDLGLSSENKKEKRHLIDEWMKNNAEKYGGQYVALDGKKLLGTGKNYAEAAKAARRAGVENAFIDYVRPTDYVGETGGW